MFDISEIRVKAGDGGDGFVGFRREMYVPFGGPDGGDGGRGGDVIIRASNSADSLRNYRHTKTYTAENGRNGAGRKKHGKDGANLILDVPAGTIITEIEKQGNEIYITDLEKEGDQVVIAGGGRGGWGNVHYVSSTNQAPRIAQRGAKGEERHIKLEMRLIADVGIIGYPNAGKSTLLAAASAATPKIASYPFTTLEPVLGVVEVDTETFVMAEIPGLIEGAHLGRGLGYDFLRHAMRTRILIHLISGASESPSKDMMAVNEELRLFDHALEQKTQIIVINKIDMPEVQEKLKSIKEELTGSGIKAQYISAATGQGVPALMKETFKVLKTISPLKETEEKNVKVFRPQPREPRIKIEKVGEEYVITASGLERIMGGHGVSRGELAQQLNHQLKRLGVTKALEKAGAKPGDKMRCGELTWEW